MLTKRPFKVWTDEEQAVWRILFERQYPRIADRAVNLYNEGHAIMGLTGDHLPDFEKLDQVYQDRVGWELVSTPVQYSDGQSWFEHLVKKQFLVTEYIRDRDSLDYTPLPDIFHDAFGHLPHMTNQRYADLVLDYSKLMLACPKEARAPLGSIWWYTIEFGLMYEDGKLKAFGTGLMSSYEEFDVAFSDRMERRPFDPADIGPVKPSPHEIHKVLWILDDMEQLEDFVHGEMKKYGVE